MVDPGGRWLDRTGGFMVIKFRDHIGWICMLTDYVVFDDNGNACFSCGNEDYTVPVKNVAMVEDWENDTL